MKNIGEDGTGWPSSFFPKNLGNNAIVGYPYPERSVAIPILLTGALFVWLCMHYAVAWYWCLPGVIAFIILMCSVSRQVIVDPTGKTVQILHRLFMRWTLKVEIVPISNIKTIVYTTYDQAEEMPKKRVGLSHQDGRKVWLRAFNCDGTKPDSSRAAESFAWRLSCDTDLPIEENPIKTIF